MIAEGLRSNNSLLLLDLANNHIGSAGCMAIARVLTTSSAVETLDLSINDIEHPACHSLARMLSARSLRCLLLNDNPLGATGTSVILQAADSSPGLQQLGMQVCSRQSPSVQVHVEVSTQSCEKIGLH